MEPQMRGKPPVKPERSQTSLWFVIVGMGVAIGSRALKDEYVAQVVLWFGVAFALVALIYYIFQPKHGFR